MPSLVDGGELIRAAVLDADWFGAPSFWGWSGEGCPAGPEGEAGHDDAGSSLGDPLPQGACVGGRDGFGLQLHGRYIRRNGCWPLCKWRQNTGRVRSHDGRRIGDGDSGGRTRGRPTPLNDVDGRGRQAKQRGKRKTETVEQSSVLDGEWGCSPLDDLIGPCAGKTQLVGQRVSVTAGRPTSLDKAPFWAREETTSTGSERVGRMPRRHGREIQPRFQPPATIRAAPKPVKGLFLWFRQRTRPFITVVRSKTFTSKSNKIAPLLGTCLVHLPTF